MSAEAIDDALQVLLGRPEGTPPLAALRIRPATAEELRESTTGEVMLGESLAADTLAPIEGGLFCERIFGSLGAAEPTRAAYLSVLEPPLIRAREDDVLPPRERLERFGRITLAEPIDHPLLTRASWSELLGEAGLESWPLEVLPVLPPDLRAVVPVEGGERMRFAVSDLHELYREVIQANARLARVKQLRVPPSVLEVEQGRLAVAIAQLFDNASTTTPKLGPAGRPLMGILGMLAHPSRPLWGTLAELDGMVARGVVRTLAPPLAKRSLLVLWQLRGLALMIDIVAEPPSDSGVATVH
ncbi:hypothetical protein [Sandaracinus amylolyticus]|uniref:DNA-directed RNA polymerase n=1 Tax=Sandaracinus amylolyticus TaxID=927083 RepID=A0A0F6W3D3_9BACT|nr:hypothetical protein [Sandaracinus amylolyticus]AKF06380.1 DNA-directed RNA polymerase beta' subunit [Sandaracinus amylolyticus]